MTCCFIGHRKEKHQKELERQLLDVVRYLIAQNVTTFLFGVHFDFNTLCYGVVSELKETNPTIRRVHVRTDYPNADAYTMRFLTEGYEDSISPDGIASVERNQTMILASDFCVFYYNENYLPDLRKASKKALTS